MKSKTSFFSITVIKKNITRFAPVWGLYTIFLLLVFFAVARNGYPAILARQMVLFMNTMPLVNLLYGGLCAIVLFGDLYNSRICNALHALPLRREGWLVTHILSGILFSAVPNFLVSVLASFLMLEYAYIAWIWLAVAMLQFLFFFGTGVLSAVCAGNRLAMVAIYGIIHFITVLVFGVITLIYQPLLYGLYIDFENYSQFIPLIHMMKNESMYISYEYYPVNIEFQFNGWNGAGWRYIALCSGVGLLCSLLGYMVYRRRNLESAGDFISLKPVSPVFLIIYTVGVGSVFYLFSELFNEASYVYLAFGLIVGFFTGLMLLRRTTKVFSKKSVFGCIAFVVIFAGSIWLTWLDPLGITTKIPDREDVQWAAAYSTDHAYGYTEDAYPYRFCITDEVEVVSLQQYHARLAEDKKLDSENTDCQVRMHYKLKDGSDFIRYYEVDPNSDLGQETKMRFSDMRYLFQVNDPAELYNWFSDVQIECFDMDMGDQWKLNPETDTVEKIVLTEKEQINGLLDAIRKDSESGYIAQQHQFHENESFVFYISFDHMPDEEKKKEEDWGYWYNCDLQIYSSCIHTINYLKQQELKN